MKGHVKRVWEPELGDLVAVVLDRVMNRNVTMALSSSELFSSWYTYSYAYKYEHCLYDNNDSHSSVNRSSDLFEIGHVVVDR